MNLRDALQDARMGRSRSLRCPAHEDHRPSLSVFRGRHGWVILKCFAGCSRGSILCAAGLRVSDLGPPRANLRNFLRLPIQHARAQPVELEIAPPDRAKWPQLDLPSGHDIPVLGKLRGIPVSGLLLAVERGILRFGYFERHRSWIVTDPSNCVGQARRMDGGKWFDELKAWTFKGSIGSWPVGLGAVTPKHSCVLLCEGGPDLLAAHSVIVNEGRQEDTAAVCMLGAEMTISPAAIPRFAGRTVRIIEHDDPAGRKAGQKWADQLKTIATKVQWVRFDGLVDANRRPCKDLNDVISMGPDLLQPEAHLIPRGPTP